MGIMGEFIDKAETSMMVIQSIPGKIWDQLSESEQEAMNVAFKSLEHLKSFIEWYNKKEFVDDTEMRIAILHQLLLIFENDKEENNV